MSTQYIGGRKASAHRQGVPSKPTKSNKSTTILESARDTDVSILTDPISNSNIDLTAEELTVCLSGNNVSREFSPNQIETEQYSSDFPKFHEKINGQTQKCGLRLRDSRVSKLLSWALHNRLQNFVRNAKLISKKRMDRPKDLPHYRIAITSDPQLDINELDKKRRDELKRIEERKRKRFMNEDRADKQDASQKRAADDTAMSALGGSLDMEFSTSPKKKKRSLAPPSILDRLNPGSTSANVIPGKSRLIGLPTAVSHSSKDDPEKSKARHWMPNKDRHEKRSIIWSDCLRLSENEWRTRKSMSLYREELKL